MKRSRLPSGFTPCACVQLIMDVKDCRITRERALARIAESGRAVHPRDRSMWMDFWVWFGETFADHDDNGVLWSMAVELAGVRDIHWDESMEQVFADIGDNVMARACGAGWLGAFFAVVRARQSVLCR